MGGVSPYLYFAMQLGMLQGSRLGGGARAASALSSFGVAAISGGGSSVLEITHFCFYIYKIILMHIYNKWIKLFSPYLLGYY